MIEWDTAVPPLPVLLAEAERASAQDLITAITLAYEVNCRMVDAFAEYERAIIRARTRAALAVKRGRGERTGEVPYGFRLAEDAQIGRAHV